MKKNLHLNIKELTRVEGHGNIVVDIKKGEIKELRFDIIESPRFFEVMLTGRRYDEAHHIMARICGICSVSHTAAALKAIESAMGIKISPQSRLIRRLAFAAENMQSHILHLFFLVLPDLFGVGSIEPLLEKHPWVVKTGLSLKRIANKVSTVVGGRPVHPISLAPGGVVYVPTPRELKELKSELRASFEELDYALSFLNMTSVPRMDKAREFIALKAKGEYALYDGTPTSSKGYAIKPENFSKKIKESVVEHSTAKHARSPGGTFMVGALARLNNNMRQLKPRAKAAANKAGLKPPFTNPFLNNMAQLIECFHLTEEAIEIIDLLLKMGPKLEPIKEPTGHGRGVGIVEAPRGTLYHDYTIDKDGIIEKANCIIPTAMNLSSIDEDLRAIVPSMLDEPKEVIAKTIETLVRAYDPCISCSTHIMDVSFV
jgi:coenzyme F420-reducing hydrogenase alpha subunit